MLLKGRLVYCHLAKVLLDLDRQHRLLGCVPSLDTWILISPPPFGCVCSFCCVCSSTSRYLAGLKNYETVELIFSYFPKEYLIEEGGGLTIALS